MAENLNDDVERALKAYGGDDFTYYTFGAFSLRPLVQVATTTLTETDYHSDDDFAPPSPTTPRKAAAVPAYSPAPPPTVSRWAPSPAPYHEPRQPPPTPPAEDVAARVTRAAPETSVLQPVWPSASRQEGALPGEQDLFRRL